MKTKRWLLFCAGILGGGLVGAIVVAVWVASSFDTEYAPGYSQEAFDAIRPGAARADVLARLGPPLAERATAPYTAWIYSDAAQPGFADTGIGQGTYTMFVFDTEGRVASGHGQLMLSPGTIRIGEAQDHLRLSGRRLAALRGLPMEAVRARFGPPAATYAYRASSVLVYSRSPSSSNYRRRAVGLDPRDRVVQVWKETYWD